jgi:ketosteroid isomerase-like protein
VTKVIRSKDCGNSPKNKLLEEVEIALANRDVGFLLTSVTDDVHWRFVGHESLRGANALFEALHRTSRPSEVAEITIHHVVTHGKAGAVNGTRKHKDGKTYGFCTVYEFSNAKGTSVSGITHYAIEGG